MTSGRALRAGLLTTILVSGFWGLVAVAMSGDGCTSRPTNPYPCLGGQVLVVVAGPVAGLTAGAWSAWGPGRAPQERTS